MTIFELFPWLLAILVGLFSTIGLSRLGVSGIVASVVGLLLGFAVLLANIFFQRKILPWLELRKMKQERSEITSRQYQVIDLAKEFPREKGLIYECTICGNVVPSVSKKGATCKCHNITVEPDSERIVIQDPTKAKLFSRAAA